MASSTATDFVRTRLNVSRKRVKEDEASSDEFLRLLRQHHLDHLQLNDLCDFKDICTCLHNSARTKNTDPQEVDEKVAELLQVAREMSGDANQSLKFNEIGATFVLQTFHDSIYVNNVIGTTSEHREYLATVFDPKCLTGNVVSRAYEVSKQVSWTRSADQ